MTMAFSCSRFTHHVSRIALHVSPFPQPKRGFTYRPEVATIPVLASLPWAKSAILDKVISANSIEKDILYAVGWRSSRATSA